MRVGQKWGVDRGNAKKYLEKAPAATFQDQKRDFSPKKGACGNVPGPKTHFFIKKSACGNVPPPKTYFSQRKAPAATFQDQKRFFSRKRRLRQRTRTKNAFFQQKKAPAATYQDQKRIFHKKIGACGSVPGRKKHFFADRGLPNSFFKHINPLRRLPNHSELF